MAKILLENLTKNYGDTIAVDRFSAEIGAGEFVVILGPSGCGKTTLLRCVAGLERPDGGHVYIDGELVDDLPPKERDLTMVFQNYALFPHMTVYQNIAFPLKVRRRPQAEIETRVREMAKFLGIVELLDKKPGQLSGGEQQRAAIARAIVRQPRAFLMDEPLSNLDAPLRAYMRTELKRIQKEFQVTAIYVTHDQLEALSLATRMAVMNRGSLIQLDRPEVVYSSPSTAFVAGFVGNPPANLVNVSLAEEGGFTYLRSSGIKYLWDGVAVGPLSTDSNELILAIRPEDIRVSTSRTSSTAQEGKVYSIELLGASTLLNVEIGGQMLKAIVAPELKVNPEQRIWLEFEGSKLHIFEKKSGLLLA